MSAPGNTVNIGAARTNAGFLNLPAFERTRLAAARLRSGVFGNLSIKLSTGEYKENSGTERTGTDITKSAAIVRVEKSSGDTHTWTMTKQLKGPPTFGDVQPEKAGFLDFLNAEVVLAKTRSPAFQVAPDMDLQRIRSVTDLTESQYEQELRDQTVKWYADAIPHNTIMAFLKGATDNALQPVTNGGRAINLGRGAGVQVSPLNAIVRGASPDGIITGATLAARETNLKAALANLSASNANHLISTAALQEISEILSTGTILLDPVDIGGEPTFYCILPSVCRLQLLGAGSAAVDYAKYTAAWGKNSPLLKMQPLQVGNLVVFFDNILSKYAPDVTGSEIVWGKNTTNFQSWGYKDLTAAQKGRGIGIILGRRALLEASYKGITYTQDEGPHGTSKEISSYVKDSMVRAMWVDKSDSAVMPIDQGSLLFGFAYKGITNGN